MCLGGVVFRDLPAEPWVRHSACPELCPSCVNQACESVRIARPKIGKALRRAPNAKWMFVKWINMVNLEKMIVISIYTRRNKDLPRSHTWDWNTPAACLLSPPILSILVQPPTLMTIHLSVQPAGRLVSQTPLISSSTYFSTYFLPFLMKPTSVGYLDLVKMT